MILLLGGGYTLTRLANKLSPDSFLITSTKTEKVEIFKSRGFNALKLDLDSPVKIEDLDLIIDSIPPTEGHVDKLKKFYELNVPKRVIYLSTTGVFGYQNGELVNELSECHPQHSSGMARLEVENFYKAQSFKTCSLRLPAIYGPKRGIGLALKNQTMPLIADGERYTNRIHVDDLVGILQKLVALDNLPDCLCINDQNPSLMKDVVKFYCEKFNLPAPKSISLAQAIEQGFYHSILNQRVDNRLVNELLDYQYLYPSYLEGAGSEFQ